MVWARFRINYVYILDLDPAHTRTAAGIFRKVTPL
jgi:hypothetical protein